GKAVGLLADQDPGRAQKGGVFVPFFGRWSLTSAGVSFLARTTGAAVVPVFITRCGRMRHRVEFMAPLEFSAGEYNEEAAVADMLLVNRVLERWISEHPGEWFWLHNRWKSGGRPVETGGRMTGTVGENGENGKNEPTDNWR
ncbi:MAG: lysophospholipid acyltransferase family protein, partial [Negativicutes bacterium]|nr:lysophospholipid acyltransferase family protein [Negativicutes bacterium]